MAQVDLLAILTPKPGKTDRVVELLKTLSEWVKVNEPGTLRYHVHREVNKKNGVEEVFMLESYTDKKALGIHGNSDKFKAFSKALKDEGLLEGAPKLKFLKEEGGFASKL
ncbi:hypothetical protein F5884DRAFT_101713 [Xylogone sp. PMI_703]|nr:hypothetical protein F5884DRAFT_101713 [Xylogone sp. PMI_703]